MFNKSPTPLSLCVLFLMIFASSGFIGAVNPLVHKAQAQATNAATDGQVYNWSIIYIVDGSERDVSMMGSTFKGTYDECKHEAKRVTDELAAQGAGFRRPTYAYACQIKTGPSPR